MKLRELKMFDKGDEIAYFFNDTYDNYHTCKRIFGAAKFPKSDLAEMKKRAAKEEYEIVLIPKEEGPKPSSHRRAMPSAPEVPAHGFIDKKLGIFKCSGPNGQGVLHSEEFVINCVDRQLIPKKHARFIGVSSHDGLPYWIHNEQDIIDSSYAWPSVFEKDGIKPRQTKINLLKVMP